MTANTQDITDFKNSNALISHNIERPMLVDEVSDTEFYIGYSQNTPIKNTNNWRIKRIWQVSSVWNFGFPEGNQNFEFNWDLRDTYTYSA